jgi:hypothetical protein
MPPGYLLEAVVAVAELVVAEAADTAYPRVVSGYTLEAEAHTVVEAEHTVAAEEVRIVEAVVVEGAFVVEVVVRLFVG